MIQIHNDAVSDFLQVQIRRLPKPVIAMVISLSHLIPFTFYGLGSGSMLSSFSCKKVAGYAVGGGHVLHMVCDLTIAADNAIFGQTGPKVCLSFLLIDDIVLQVISVY